MTEYNWPQNILIEIFIALRSQTWESITNMESKTVNVAIYSFQKPIMIGYDSIGEYIPLLKLDM